VWSIRQVLHCALFNLAYELLEIMFPNKFIVTVSNIKFYKSCKGYKKGRKLYNV